MDKIELVVTHQTGNAVTSVWSAVFGMAGGTIGRAGQNKLVLPDSDAEVARVHAMVRLDSDQAYIANLCERRAVIVNGLEVLPGQEIPLLPGADVDIGPYRLRAFEPGESRVEAAVRHESSLEAALNAGVPANHSAPNPDAEWTPSDATRLNLASLPNPWADLPAIVGGDPYTSELAQLHSTTEQAVAVDSSSDNPFSMLGRIESHQTACQPQNYVPSNVPANHAPAQDAHTAPQEPQTVGNSSVEKDASATTLVPSKTSEHRSLVIPDDFDPFAPDSKSLVNQHDSWSGDLTAKSLAEVTQLKNDELLQSLPKTSQFAGEMDNAAHTGLPRQLDPGIELNPLKLFREPGESMYAEVEDHGLSRGSDLAQIFNMPREARGAIHANSDADLAEPALPESKVAISAVAAGLLPAQGLDLDMFGAAEQTIDVELLDLGAATATHGTTLTKPAPEVPVGTAHPVGGEEAARHRAQSLSKDGLAQNQPSTVHQGVAHVNPGTPAAKPANPAPVGRTSEVQSGDQALDAPMQELIAAFLEGAGIAPDQVQFSISPDFMRGFGEALRTAVQGSIDLLSARSEIKREFRADVTIIASGANNPLKFLPNADGVMLQLTGQTFPGFMKPVPAMKEAYKDLAVHQIALMAGIRAAYAEATARLSPSALEDSAAGSAGFLSKLSTVHRKAAFWDDYQQRFESIRRHAEDDLMAFSGKTFVEAYENAAQAAGGTL